MGVEPSIPRIGATQDSEPSTLSYEYINLSLKPLAAEAPHAQCTPLQEEGHRPLRAALFVVGAAVTVSDCPHLAGPIRGYLC